MEENNLYSLNNVLKNIITIRNGKGFSQQYVASKLNIQQGGYGLIERGERGLQYSTLVQIALIFEMSVIDLLLYPKNEIKNTENNSTKVLVELEVSNDEFIKLGLKKKVLQILDK